MDTASPPAKSSAATAPLRIAPRVRADAQRNRELILEAARTAFSSGAEQVSLEAIAREAGVGIGTLYRHFPTREALVEVVHRDGLAVVLARADELLAAHDPATALRLWMDDYADFVGRKRGMAESLRALSQAGVIAASDTRTLITETLQRFLKAGVQAGTFHNDVRSEDIAASLVGIFLAADSPHSPQAGRMLNLLFAGIHIPESQTQGTISTR